MVAADDAFASRDATEKSMNHFSRDESIFASIADQIESDWRSIARPEQLPPPGDWSVWLILAGRGAGKTPHQIWHDFMLRHVIPYHEPQVLGALDADGNEVQGLWLVNRPRIVPRLRRKYRKWRNITRIVGGANDIVLLK